MIFTNYTVKRTLNGLDGTFYVDINVPFIPDIIRVSNIVYSGDEGGFSRITTNIIRSLDNTLGVFGQTNANPTSLDFECGLPISRTVRFDYENNPARTGILCFTLTFIKE
jgi:hypothetical protein